MNFSSRQDQLFTNSKGLLRFSNAVAKVILSVQTQLMTWWPSVIASVLHVHIFIFLLKNSKDF